METVRKFTNEVKMTGVAFYSVSYCETDVKKRRGRVRPMLFWLDDLLYRSDKQERGVQRVYPLAR